MLNMFAGDPLDRSLRKVEIDILIPKIMRDKARDEKCSEEVSGKSHGYAECSH
jgi:COX assembly protein 1